MTALGKIVSPPRLVGPSDPPPVGIRNDAAQSPFLMICDHAGNAVPAALADLGLPRAELERHIAIDIGILGTSEALSDLLGTPLVFQRYSRLVVECNRREASTSFIASMSDGTLVPGNQSVSEADRRARIREIAVPYHGEIAGRIDRRLAAGEPVLLIAMHSFTPMLQAVPESRPWHIGLCFHQNRVFSDYVLAELGADTSLIIGKNQPYSVNMKEDYSIPIHAEARGLPYVEIEIRQDLIASPEGQAEWAARLAIILQAAYRRFDAEMVR
jgi:predicted N-formylglutamate amidohydrolase